MAVQTAHSPIAIISEATGTFFGRMMEAFDAIGKARAAHAMFNELSFMSDEELSKHGLKRDEIARTINAKVFDLR